MTEALDPRRHLAAQDPADEPVDRRTKGLPAGLADLRLGDIGAQGWSLLREDVPLPVAVLRESAVDRNAAWMRHFLGDAGALFAPHGKTTMSPQLFRRQLADGAWAITVATAHQLRVARSFGIGRIVLANQLVGPQDIRYVLGELRADPAFALYCLVDSVEGVRRLARAAAADPPGRPLRVLLECGFVGGRAGCRDLAGALAVAQAVKAAEPLLELHGVEGFEGLAQYLPAAEGVPRATALLDFVVETARRLDEADLFAGDRVILTAGGSSYYDLVVRVFGRAGLKRSTTIVTRSGCYLAHDAGLYERRFAELRERAEQAGGLGPGPTNALEVWAYVLSVPEPTRVILNAGRRDFGHDAGLPVPLTWFRPGRHAAPLRLDPGHAVAAVSDQHAHLEVPPDTELRVGDMVALGVSHPCTTFDRWQLVYLVDDEYRITSAIKTFF